MRRLDFSPLILSLLPYWPWYPRRVSHPRSNPDRLVAFIREQGAPGAGSSTLPHGSPFSRNERGTLALIHHREHLNLDQLLRLPELEHRNIGRGRLVVERREIRVDDSARLADVAHARSCAEDEI